MPKGKKIDIEIFKKVLKEEKEKIKQRGTNNKTTKRRT